MESWVTTMPEHTVKPGECLSSIAADYGFGDWKALYDHPSNAALRRKRENPHLLFPGDTVSIPEKQIKQTSVKTGESLKLSVYVPQRELKLTLIGPDGQAIADQPFTVEGDDTFVAGTTDGAGKLSVLLPATLKRALLETSGYEWEMHVGMLNPLDNTDDHGVSGVQGRLIHLGFNPGPIDGLLTEQTRAALRAFERKYGLPVTGKSEGKTIEKLKEVHGG